MSEPEGFRDFVAARSAALVRSAWLLTGDETTAQDLVQVALVKTWARWARLARQDAPEAYVRRVMLSTFLTWNRRRWRGEFPVAALSSGCGTVDHGPPSRLPFGQHTPDPGPLAIETALPGLVAEDLAPLARVVSLSQRAAALRA